MAQIESGIIHQLSKGCCFTERAFMFLISMLMLSMGVQTVFACDCVEIDWAQQFCRDEDKTVLMAGEIDVNTIGSSSRYTMRYERLFRLGSINITVSTKNIFTMVTPSDCSPTFLAAKQYIIYGNTGRDGVLHSSRCNTEFIDDFYNRTDADYMREILWGGVIKSCRGDN
ncbi:hypothetical protein ACJMK2_014725 [Sinanodonta woodiana]|uniref:Uncharacterized protein n=1 Tax=Sinanodonta woodiana TaxID=1069815 RepID=A0ABD3V4A5_SINWO